ncbi:beta-flanking protein [Cyathus striatus]|nr:beta-flanking protein [Cyathus striatus]
MVSSLSTVETFGRSESKEKDSFVNLAKKGYEAYQDSQSDVSKTGGQEYNSPHHSGQSQSHSLNFNEDEVVQTAQNHGSGDSSLFSSALSFVSKNKKSHEEPVDEGEVTRAHEKVYQQGEASNMSAGSLGSAAAMQVLKQFVSGSGSKGSGQNSQTQLISLAMAEATKLFDKSGGAASGDKQDAVNGAAMTVMKLLVQSKFSGGTAGGNNSGGLSGLLGLASQFAK